jgi:neopullulanase
MMNGLPARRAVISTAACVCALVLWSYGQAPSVQKLDPPNWWVGFAPNVLVMARGENLGAARVETSYPGVRIVRSEASANGHYLFLWLDIASTAVPGEVAFQITGSGGKGGFRWPLWKRAPQAGRFQGITKDDVLYLIMPDRFADGDPTNDQPPQSPGTYDRHTARAYHGGDLRGIRDHLDYLKDLGVTAVWLNPVYDNDNHSREDYHGYGAVDFYAVDEHLGTLKEFQELVAAAHERGMKIVLDVVVNHTGPKHPWVDDLPQPEWFHGTREQHRESHGTFGPLTDPHALRVQYEDLMDGWFANILPDLKQENPLVTQYLIDNNLWWAEITGLDAFRLDTFPYVPRQFWSEWHKALFDVYPQMTTVGEVFNPDPTITSFFAGGEKRFDGIDTRVPTVFDFPMYETLRGVLNKDAPARQLVEVLQRDWMYPRPESLVTFIGNHDTTRFFTNAGESLERVENAFSLLLTMRGIPQIYSGDEIAMPGGEDPDNRRDFPGGFPGDKENAFMAAGRTAAEQEVFARVQGLLRLRKEHAALREGRQVHLEYDDTSYVFLRELDADRVLVVFNNGAASRKFAVDLGSANAEGVKTAQAMFGAPPASVQNGALTVEAPAHSVAVYLLH